MQSFINYINQDPPRLILKAMSSLKMQILPTKFDVCDFKFSIITPNFFSTRVYIY